ncbi:MAG: hypothetical protein Hyperionvirus13_6 [Hyperionvirus sp.]|uniref:Uncharacterized protein n=1 Tax=Hyperionvirus sp. TaxID=2487770 RepID=A0A3G5AB75_9VIRU|nr:MAG: hypothetical protein Hyperionvirus13_6 [Hyperionvirus sp.]
MRSNNKIQPSRKKGRTASFSSVSSNLDSVREDFNDNESIKESESCETCFMESPCSCINCIIASCLIRDAPQLEETINTIYSSIFKCCIAPRITQFSLATIQAAYSTSFQSNVYGALNSALSMILTNPTYAINIGMLSIAANTSLPANAIIPRCDFGSIPYYIKLPSLGTSKIEVIWPILKVVKDLARTLNTISLITVTMALVTLSNNTILDANTACPIQVNNIFSEVTQNCTTGLPNGLNNVCLALEDIKEKFGQNAVPFISQFFVFRTDHILNLPISGNFIIAVVFLTDFTGLTFPYIAIFDNCSGNMLFQLGNPTIPFSFIPKCKAKIEKSKYSKNTEGIWVLQHESPIITVNLNTLQQISQGA